MTTISELPAAPNKETDSAATFSSKANTWVAALPGFITQANAVAGEVNSAAGAAADSEAAAALEAVAAAESAASAVNAPGTSATSATTMTPAVGSKSFTLAQVDKNFVVGMHVIVAETAASSTNWMHGIITAFIPGTGEMTIAADLVSTVVASASAWTVALSGPAVTQEISIGFGQSWQTPSRIAGTVYQNTTGKSIQVSIMMTNGATAGYCTFYVDDVSTPTQIIGTTRLPAGANTDTIPFSFIVPPNHYYKATLTGGIQSAGWYELR